MVWSHKVIFLFQVKELEDESRNQMEQREKEEAEEGPLATILGTMKRTIKNADGLRFITVLLTDDNSGFIILLFGFSLCFIIQANTYLSSIARPL